MAFVLIQHLSPGHESMLAQLLSRETADARSEVEDGTILAPNQVYVIPPNAAMTISGLTLALKPRDDGRDRHRCVSPFPGREPEERSGCGHSFGDGSDGALGVQAIGEEGGVVFAQDPASAKFDGMPRSAIATGCVDLVLSPEGIAMELARIAPEPHIVKRDRSGNLRLRRKASSSSRSAARRTGIDFSLYRQTTIRRN